jgi:hypothetical protein
MWGSPLPKPGFSGAGSIFVLSMVLKSSLTAPVTNPSKSAIMYGPTSVIFAPDLSQNGKNVLGVKLLRRPADKGSELLWTF